MLNSHMRLVATILDGTDTEHFIRQNCSRETYWSIFRQNYMMSRWVGVGKGYRRVLKIFEAS